MTFRASFAITNPALRSVVVCIWFITACSSSEPSPADAANAGAPGGGQAGANHEGGSTSSGGTDASGGGTDASGGPPTGASGAGGEGNPHCEPQAVTGTLLPITSRDYLGYPPYALEACRLAYVAPAGDLKLKDLVTGLEVVLAPASESPRRPTLTGELVAWEATLADKSQVRVKFGSASPRTLSGSFHHAAEPRASADAVVFTAWHTADENGDSDVYLYVAQSEDQIRVTEQKGQQRFADVSATHVAFSDFSEDASGIFRIEGSSADIVIFDRATRQTTTRALPGKQAFPMLGSDGFLAYLDWVSVHPEPKFSSFAIRRGNVMNAPALDQSVKSSGEVRTNPAYVRPAVRGVHLAFVDETAQGPQLFRARLDNTAPPVPVLTHSGLLGPATDTRMTVVARDLGTKLELMAILQ